MQKGLKLDGQMRALAMALGGAITMSVIAMLVPVGVWEAITGSTGISELIPATGAPLGDTARAIIAFLFGAGTFAVLAIVLLRKPAAPVAVRTIKDKVEAADPTDLEADNESFVTKMRGRISDFVESRRKGVIVTELSDLPKLRAGDAHPDAPPRRPISAHTDFAPIVPEPVVEEAVIEPSADGAAPNVNVQTVSAMVDRLEAAVAQRRDQLAKLESLATTEVIKPQIAADTVEVEIVGSAPRLEAVPREASKSTSPHEMDAALRSALETLHRMNVRTR
jgi:hypothetical protein